MLPVVAIVGRPNVGKSTLFNCLTRSRSALVADEPGVTRDRQFGISRAGSRPFVVVDTGGLRAGADEFARMVSNQALRAADESDVVLLLVDARDGLTADDERIAADLRRHAKPLVVVANKTDGLDPVLASVEFHSLGLGEPIAIAAAHRRGIGRLFEATSKHFPSVQKPESSDATGIRVAIVGRPNVGKSTLVNRLVGEERVITHDAPGTTRDSLEVPFERAGRRYTLIDTAGIRRRSRVEEKIEKFSVIKALEAIHACDVAVLLMDATEEIAEQDARLLGHVLDAGRALVLGINKWDALGEVDRRQVRASVRRKLAFADYARIHFISGRHGRGLDALLHSVKRAWRAARAKLPTPELTRALAEAVRRNPPPLARGRRIKLRYAHQGGSAPPRVVVHGNQTAAVPEAYRRYLANTLRRRFALEGTPLKIEFRTADNPYRGKRNPLTPRQKRHRKRVLRHGRKS